MKQVKIELPKNNDNNKCLETYGHNVSSLLGKLGNGAFSDHTLGKGDWRSFWTFTVNQISHQRFLPPVTSVAEVNKSHSERKISIKSESAEPTPRIHMPQIYARPQSDGSKALSLIAKSTNLKKRFKTNDRNDTSHLSHDTVLKAVEDLPRSKKMYLIDSLAKLQQELEDSMDEDDEECINDTMSVTSSIKGDGKRNGGVSLASSSSITAPTIRKLPQKYGGALVKAPIDNTRKVLLKIGKAMNNIAFKALNYDLTGRGRVENLAPTLLRTRLSRELSLSFTTNEITLLYKKFDVDMKGAIDIVTIYGNAKLLVGSMAKSSKRNKKCNRNTSQDTNIVVEEDIEVEKTDDIVDVDIQRVLDKLAGYACEAIQSGSIRPLDTMKPRVNLREFRQLLNILDIGLSSGELELVEQRYKHMPSGLIDIVSFRKEFKSLGDGLIQGLKQYEAREAFMDALSARDEKESDYTNDRRKNIPNCSDVHGPLLLVIPPPPVPILSTSASHRSQADLTQLLNLKVSEIQNASRQGTSNADNVDCASVRSMTSSVSFSSNISVSRRIPDLASLTLEMSSDLVTPAAVSYHLKPPTSADKLRRHIPQSSDTAILHSIRPDMLTESFSRRSMTQEMIAQEDTYAALLVTEQMANAIERTSGSSCRESVNLDDELASVYSEASLTRAVLLSSTSSRILKPNGKEEVFNSYEEADGRAVSEHSVSSSELRRRPPSIDGNRSQTSVTSQSRNTTSRNTTGRMGSSGLFTSRASRGLLPNSPKSMVDTTAVTATKPTSSAEPWRSDSMVEDCIGNMDVLSSLASNIASAIQANHGEDDEDDSSWNEVCNRGGAAGRNHRDGELEDDEEDVDDDEDEDDIYQAANGRHMGGEILKQEEENENEMEEEEEEDGYSVPGEQRSGLVDEVLRLAEDLLRLSSNSDNLAIPVDESREEEDEMEAGCGEEDEYEGMDYEDECGYGDEDEEYDNDDENMPGPVGLAIRSTMNASGTMSMVLVEVGAGRSRTSVPETELDEQSDRSEDSPGTGSGWRLDHELGSDAGQRRGGQHPNNQEEDREDDLRVKSKIDGNRSGCGVGSRMTESEQIESDDDDDSDVL